MAFPTYSGPRKRKLTVRQQRFADGVLAGLTFRAAYEEAGYSTRGNAIKIRPSELMKEPTIANYIADQRAKLSKKTEITAERILQELTRIAFADIRSLFIWDEERACYVPSRELTDDEAAAIQAVKAKTTRFTTEDGTEKQEIHLELKTYDKLSALEKIMKHLGMFIERSEHHEQREVTVRFIRE